VGSGEGTNDFLGKLKTARKRRGVGRDSLGRGEGGELPGLGGGEKPGRRGGGATWARRGATSTRNMDM
jgi:hypothetical protein